MAESDVDMSRRRFLTTTTAVVGGAGVAAAAAPFVASMNPSVKAKASGAPVEVNVGKLEPGQLVTVDWRGKPIWIVKRTERQLELLQEHASALADPDSEVTSQQPSYTQNPTRSIRPEVAVLVGVCTHLGCSPSYRPDVDSDEFGKTWHGGFFCPCHGSRFDLAGRVYKGVPAPTNLAVPPYRYASDNEIVVGEDGGTA